MKNKMLIIVIIVLVCLSFCWWCGYHLGFNESGTYCRDKMAYEYNKGWNESREFLAHDLLENGTCRKLDDKYVGAVLVNNAVYVSDGVYCGGTIEYVDEVKKLDGKKSYYIFKQNSLLSQ